MNAKESLCVLLESLTETRRKMTRQLLLDFVLGNQTPDIKKRKLNDNELFGCGAPHDEEHYCLVLDKAIKDDLIKPKDKVLSVTPQGKKALKDKSDKPYIVNEEEEEQPEPDRAAIVKVQRLAQNADPVVVTQQQENIGWHTKLKIQLIQAMDRKIALDYFAEQNNLAFDDVLLQLEDMKHNGRTFDISYFINEVMDQTSQQELMRCIDEANGDINSVMKEYGDIFSTEEVRLLRLKWK